MTVRDYAGAAPRTALSVTISNSALSFTVIAGGGTGYPTGAGGNFYVALDAGLAGEEKILCSSRTGDVFTVATGGRGADDTTAAAHNNGATVDHVGTATDLREANGHVNASSGVHGRTGAVVGTTDAQTLTNKTLTTPTIGSFVNAQHDHSNGAGGGTVATSTPAAVAARVTKSGVQSLSHNAVTALVFDTEDFDTTAIHSTVTNTTRLTVPSGKAGKWLVNGSVGYASNATGVRYAALVVNGSAYKAATETPAGSDVVSAMVSTVLNLAAGDYIELMGYQTSGGALDVLATEYTHFSATFLGA